MKFFLSLPIFLSQILTSCVTVVADGNSNGNIRTAESRPPKAHELTSEYSFQQYLMDFNKPQLDPNSQEYSIKKEIFESNLEMILNHNQYVIYDLETGEMKVKGSENGHTFHMGVNRFMDYTTEELKSSFFGYDKSLSTNAMMIDYLSSKEQAAMTTLRKMKVQYQKHNYELNLPFNITDIATLPSSFRYDKTTPIKNQGSW
jgi:hypothetical protein